MCGRWDQPMYQSRCKLTYDCKILAIFTKKKKEQLKKYTELFFLNQIFLPPQCENL
jgi:hypothetical protein